MITRRRFLSTALPAIAAAGCAPSEPPPAEQARGGVERQPSPSSSTATRLHLNLAHYPGVLCQVSWFLAAERGFFAQQGLDVEFHKPDLSKPRGHSFQPPWVLGPAGPVRTDAMPVEYPALEEMASGMLDYYVVAGEHSGCRQLVIPAASSIRSVADLQGKRVGLRPQEDTLVWQFLIGPLKPETGPTEWVRPPFEGGIDLPRELDWVKQEFAAGRIEAYIGADPIPEILVADGLARRLASNTWTPPLNGWYCCMLAVRADLVDQHPDLPGRFTRAIRAAAARVEKNPAEEVAFLVEKGYFSPSTRQDLSARLLGEYVWATTGRIEQDLERYFQLLKDAGRIPAAASPRELVKRVYRPAEA